MLSDSSIYFYTYRQFIQYIEPWPPLALTDLKR